jgi:hypothetical protein
MLKTRFCKHCSHDLGKTSERGCQHDGNKGVTGMKCCDCSTVTEMGVYPGATLFCRYCGHVMCDSCRIGGKSGKGDGEGKGKGGEKTHDKGYQEGYKADFAEG